MEDHSSNAKRIAGIIALIIVVAVVIFALSAGKKSTTMNMAASSVTPSSANAVSTSSVTIQGYAFSPAAITVKAGTTVTWTNQDAVSHTITSDSGDGPKSDLFARGQSYSYTFKTAGTFSYHCTPHPYMKGVVTVTN